MKTFVFDVVEQSTYSAEIEAETEQEARERARRAYSLGQLDKIDEELALIDLVEEYECD